MMTNLNKHYVKVHQTDLISETHQVLCFCGIISSLPDFTEYLLTHPAPITEDAPLNKLGDLYLTMQI